MKLVIIFIKRTICVCRSRHENFKGIILQIRVKTYLCRRNEQHFVKTLNSFIMDINQIMASLEAKHPGESEYLQAVKEVLHSIEDIYNQHPEFEKASLIERLVEPDRIFTFKVP